MKKYTLSKYNVFETLDDTVIGVNLVSRFLFALEPEKYAKLNQFSNDLNKLEESDPVFFSTMYKLGIITEVESNNAIFDRLILDNRLTTFDSKSFKLTINPTLNCNFDCWYCYETHTKKRMSNDVINNTIKFIDHLIDEQKISYFHLDWFGGEPLLCYDNVMKPIGEYARQKCLDNNVYIESAITTNGFLISEDKIPFFKESNFQSFQITLDGNKESHDKTRFTKDNRGSYDKIVENICLLAEKLDPNNLSLRINFTKDNFDGVSDIIESFPADLRSKITVLLQQVWQDKDSNNVTIEQTEELKQKFSTAGFKVSRELFNIRGYTCYADMYNQAVLNYDGRIFKCTAKNFEEELEDGNLLNNGEIEWNPNSLSLLISKATFENPTCKECIYLPVCFGPCSKKVALAKSEEEFKKYCFKGGIKNTLDYAIKQFHEKNITIAPLTDVHR